MDFHKNLSYGFLIPLLNAVNGNASKLFCFLNVVCFLKYRARTNHFGNLLNNNDREQPEAHRSFICNSIQMFKKKKKDCR